MSAFCWSAARSLAAYTRILVSRNSTLVQLLAIQWPHGRTGLKWAGCQLVKEFQKVVSALSVRAVLHRKLFLRPVGEEILHDFGE